MAASTHDRLVGSSESRHIEPVSRISKHQRKCKIQQTRPSEDNGGRGRLYDCRSPHHSPFSISNKRWRSELWHKAAKQVRIQVLNSAAFLVRVHGRRRWVSLKWLMVILEICFLLHISWQITLITEPAQRQQQSPDPCRKFVHILNAFCLREEAANGRGALSVILVGLVGILKWEAS